MRQSILSMPGRDQIGRLARAEVEAAAHLLIDRSIGDLDESRPRQAFAASVRAADAHLWAPIKQGGPNHE